MEISMNPDNIIEVHDVKKKYALYADPKDRFCLLYTSSFGISDMKMGKM